MKIKLVEGDEMREYYTHRSNLFKSICSEEVGVYLSSDFEKAKKELIDKMNEAIEQVELAGYDNPIDEAYHNACLMMKEIVVECFGVTK